MKKLIPFMIILLLLVGCGEKKEIDNETNKDTLGDKEVVEQTVEAPIKIQSELELEKARKEAEEALAKLKQLGKELEELSNSSQPPEPVVTPKDPEQTKEPEIPSVVVEKKKSLDKSYNWYFDQGQSGKYSSENCGPCTAAMAIKWYLPKSTITGEDARNEIRASGGWWYTNEMLEYLQKNKVPASYKDFHNPKDIVEVIDQNKLVILCIDTTYISFNENEKEKTGRWYDFEGGHFIVVKGYQVINGKLHFEVYDPMSWSRQSSDGSLAGQDRLYTSDDLKEAILRWWPHMIVVGN